MIDLQKYYLSLVFGFLGAGLFHVLQTTQKDEAKAAGTKIVTASQFDLVDSKGRVRAQLGFSSEGPPGLWILDGKGVPRIAMGLYPDETAHFGLQDKNGEMIQLMRSMGPSESPLLIFKNSGRDRMILGLTSQEVDPFFISYDKKSQKKTVYSGFADGP